MISSTKLKAYIQNIPEGAILVTVDVVDLYPSVPQEAGSNAFREALDNTKNKHIPTENLLKIGITNLWIIPEPVRAN